MTCNNVHLLAGVMESWKRFAKEIKELLKNRNFTKAQEQLAKSLEKFPNQLNLLSIATNVFRASNDHEKSLRVRGTFNRSPP